MKKKKNCKSIHCMLKFHVFIRLVNFNNSSKHWWTFPVFDIFRSDSLWYSPRKWWDETTFNAGFEFIFSWEADRKCVYIFCILTRRRIRNQMFIFLCEFNHRERISRSHRIFFHREMAINLNEITIRTRVHYFQFYENAQPNKNNCIREIKWMQFLGGEVVAS